MCLILCIFFLNDVVQCICRKTKEKKFRYIFQRYVSTLWPVPWHTLSIWVNDGPHWNKVLERNGLCHFVQKLCGCSTSKECSIWWRTHACHIHYMHGLPIQRVKKMNDIESLRLSNSIYPSCKIYLGKVVRKRTYNYATTTIPNISIQQ